MLEKCQDMIAARKANNARKEAVIKRFLCGY
jgi:hypothetical protein